MQYTHQQRMDFIAKGECYCCKEHRPLIPGKRKCAVCWNRSKVDKRTFRIKHGVGRKLCYSCCVRPPDSGFTKCAKCRAEQRVYMKRHRDRLHTQSRCVKCGCLLSENELILGKKVCFVCVEAIMKGKLI